MIVVLAQTKGGIDKSILAVNLAFAYRLNPFVLIRINTDQIAAQNILTNINATRA